jgi:hypothetical protein
LICIISVYSVNACSCLTYKSLQQTYNDAEVVFEGTFIEAKFDTVQEERFLHFKIDKYYKGDSIKSTLMVLPGSGSCRTFPKEGVRMIYYTFKFGDHISVNYCSKRIGFDDKSKKELKKFERIVSKPNGVHKKYLFPFNYLYKGDFVNGQANGIWEYYYPKDTRGFGNVKLEGKYLDGKRDGLWSYYHKGTLLATEEYKSNNLHGESITYTDSNQIEDVTMFINGEELDAPSNYSVQYFDEFAVLPSFENSPNTGARYIFPKLVGANKSTCQKINQLLTYSFLDFDLEKDSGSIFSHVWGLTLENRRLSDLEYEVKQFNNKVLSLKIGAEFYAAYSEPFHSYFNFDLETSNKVLLKDLIAEDKYEEFSSYLNSIKRSKIDSVLGVLGKVLKPGVPDSLWYADAIQMYEECLQDMNISDLVDTDYSILNDTIEIVLPRCSSHYNRSLDELWSFKILIPYDELGKYLSKYGKALLRGGD